MPARPSIDYAKKKKPQRVLILQMLSDLEWHHHRDLLAAGGGVRYSARILELKRLGYRLVDKKHFDGIGKSYRLTSLKPGKPQQRKVKVFIEPADAEDILSGNRISSEGHEAIADALERYRLNKGKL